MNFSYKRSPLQAFGFYLAYLLLGGLLGGIISGILTSVIISITNPSQLSSFQSGFKLGAYIGQIVGIIYCGTVSFLIIQKKMLFKHFGALLLALTSILLAMIGGAILGLIPTAILSTFEKQEGI